MKQKGILFCTALFLLFLAELAPSQETDKTRLATTPASKEHWDWWLPRHEAKKADAASRPIDIVLIGDSITHGWEIEFGGPGYGLGLPPERLQYYKEGAGKVVFDELLADKNVLNLGFGGDETQNLLWRLDHGAVDGLSPKTTVLMIGINNIGVSKMSAAETFAGIKAVVAKLKEKLPKSKIVLMALLPIHKDDPETGVWQKSVSELNPMLKTWAEREGIVFLDMNARFLGADGFPRLELMPDGVHPNADGYRIWYDVLRAYL